MTPRQSAAISPCSGRAHNHRFAAAASQVSEAGVRWAHYTCTDTDLVKGRQANLVRTIQTDVDTQEMR